MPSVGHLAVGLAAARLGRAPQGVSRFVWTGGLVALTFLPDADVIGFSLGIPYGAPLGHRGAMHSPAFAAAVALVLAAVAFWRGLPIAALAVAGGLVLATHGLLDTLTDGGHGVALLWPFSTERYFAPWRPIPVAPIGPRIFSADGVRLMAHEAVLFLPVWLVAAWPAAVRRMARWG